jgi:hypothetical protein
MRKLIIASAALVAIGYASAASAQESGGVVTDAANAATDAVSEVVESVTRMDQGSTVAMGAMAGYMLASAPITMPAIVGAVAGGFVTYYWYQWYYSE